MNQRIEVVGAVIVKEGKVLCTQRSATMRLPHKWEFPGGKVEAGETLKEALAREIKEELDCVIQVNEKITRTEFDYTKSKIALNTFYCSLKGDDIELLEHEAMKWVAPKELLKLTWAPADIPTVRMIMSQMND